MSTTIEIHCGGTVKVQPITHAICRIGSNANLELCMPGIEGHAATLRIQNGKRLVYNRSARAISLNGKPLQPEQTMEWGGNQVLQLADDVCLRLLGAKAESQANALSASALASPTDKSVATSSATNGVQQRRLTMLGFFCVFGVILFSSDSSSTSRKMDQEFSRVMTALAEAESEPNAGRTQQLRVELQNAMLRPDPKSKSIQNLKQILATQTPAASAAVDQQVRDFIDRYF